MGATAQAAIAKIDEALGLVYGWASVVLKDGEAVVDRQGDIIEPAELEAAMVEFMKDYRSVGEMHEGGDKGVVVEAVVMSPAKARAMGIPVAVADQMPTGAWIGVQLDPAGETFAKVRDGKLAAFSIQGTADRIPVEDE